MSSRVARDADALRAGLRGLHRDLGAEVVFGGLADGSAVSLSETFGTRTSSLRGLVVRSRTGLGGRVLEEDRPRLVADYGTASDITHEYDQQVLREGIGSLLAVPVSVLGHVRGLVYVGSRQASRVGRRAAVAATSAAQSVGQEIRVRDEVEQRVAHVDPALDPADAAATATLREVWAQVRSIADDSRDPVVAERLRELERRLSPAPPEAALLSRREVDVLSLVALGCSNAEIAERLGLGLETARSYLRNAMRKLDAHSRLEAVVTARRLGELL
ncbi:LuxR C-terminal-related transcriptional regulator [Aeromicrobium sp. CTD01-1L150]|uniref:LuxR C-terminal-related transcriptional regulator n=1 Tax=Aeromicrobium sp. CTD01-1L150 TaxID=3341830 RepID=UPI0035C0BD74